MRDSFITWPWLLFYLLYALAILVLVVNANVDTTAPWRVISMGALFGAAAYGAYNLTNYSILDNWPLSITLKDWAWGTFITTLCSTAGWWVAKLVSN